MPHETFQAYLVEGNIFFFHFLSSLTITREMSAVHSLVLVHLPKRQNVNLITSHTGHISKSMFKKVYGEDSLVTKNDTLFSVHFMFLKDVFNLYTLHCWSKIILHSHPIEINLITT